MPGQGMILLVDIPTKGPLYRVCGVSRHVLDRFAVPIWS